MLTCIEKLESVQGTIYLIAAYSYLVIKKFYTLKVISNIYVIILKILEFALQ
jgi:hypothetical protein